ncbi:MAG: hypothetical protein M9962_05855 [Oligoflexia bacterium]|nr:hypothetical protein [Oligoflexia bacterium]
MKSKVISVFGIILVMTVIFFALYHSKSTQNSIQENSSESNIDDSAAESSFEPAQQEENERLVETQKNLKIQKDEHKELTAKEIESIRREMKITLAAMYAAQKSFYSEFGRYSTDLLSIGYFPSDKEVKIKFGFLEPYVPSTAARGEDPRRLDSDQLLASTKKEERWVYEKTSKNIQLGDYRSYCANRCTASDRHFEVMVVAQFRDGSNPEIWTIDDKKNLLQISDGTSER